MNKPLLSIEDLSVTLHRHGRVVPIVEQASLALDRNQTLGIVGESGSGKSILVKSLMRLQPANMRLGGSVRFEGEDILQLSDARMRNLRGKQIAMIFQDPMASLNPVMSVGAHLEEAILICDGIRGREAVPRTRELLEMVGLPNGSDMLGRFPHELSGGMRQRVMIALAIAGRPQLLIADEPTTALDVTVQKQILSLLKQLQQELGMSIVLISHDMLVVAELAERIAVMYCGNILEYGTAEKILRDPEHPYTRGLLDAIPRIDVVGERLFSIPGTIPEPGAVIDGCRFHPRCNMALPECRVAPPELVDVGEDYSVRCIRHRAAEGVGL